MLEVSPLSEEMGSTDGLELDYDDRIRLYFTVYEVLVTALGNNDGIKFVIGE